MKVVVLLLALIVASCTKATAQSYKYCGTYMPYDTVGLSEANIPMGYRVCLINHVGRHGSRYPVSDGAIASLVKLLKAQQSNNNLTDAGVALLGMLSKQNRYYADKWGLLTEVGAEQQRGIAQRLVQRYGEGVFKSLVVWVDEKERCRQSCDAFLKQIEASCGSCMLDEDLILLPMHNSLLNFFETDADYNEFKTHGTWLLQLKEFREELLAGNNVLDDYLIDSSVVSQEENNGFLLNLYNVVAISPNIPLPDHMVPYLDEENWYLGWLIQNAHQYMMKASYDGFDQLQVDISRPLLHNFLTTSVEGLNSKTPMSYLRFAHAETVIPFAALLKIPQASQTTAIPQDIAKIWKDYIVSPMAANIVWVFCKDDNNHCLVKMMLNEHDVPFPINTASYPWYDWDDVRQYYLQLLN